MNEIKRYSKIFAMLVVVMLYMQTTGIAQATGPVKAAFEQYQQKTVQEKVFVHTDKDVYLPGEIIWFKIYAVDARFHQLFDLSKVVYVDVTDNSHNAIIQAKIAMTNGTGSGSLYIPVSVGNGSYKLRAYTNWMKNFSPDYYFEKNITIINPLKSPESTAKEPALNDDVQFFPEGGTLVAGISSKVAFKVTGPNGKGLSQYSGAVINGNSDTVARFQPLKFGIGNFTFTPAANASYKAVIKTGKGSPAVKELPVVSNQGYVMQLKDNGPSLQVVVNTNTANGPVFLFAHTRQSVKVAAESSFSSGSASFSIDKSKLGEGVSHITIFNSARQPVCERLYFKRPKRLLQVDALPDQAQYATRKKASVSIATKGAAGTAIPANLSLSVYRVDSLQHIDEDDIFSYLWLRSDLRGNIESPAYYFKNNDNEADAAVDNLMLSQGWRRFQWNNIFNNAPKAINYLPEYNDHLVTAKITNTITGRPAKDVIAYLSVPGKRVQLYPSKSDSAGRLVFNTKQLFGPGEVVVQTNTEKDSTFRIDVLSPFSEQYSQSLYPKFNLLPGQQKALEAHSLGMQVQNIYLQDKIKRFFDPGVDSSGFYAQPRKTYLLDNYTRFTTMEEVLREYVSEDNIVRSGGRFHIKVLNEKGFLEGDPLVLLDDVPVFNIDKVMAIDPLKVRKLEVFNERYFYGPTVNEGVFSFTTYKGDLGGVEMDPHSVVLDYEGMQLQREFYSPVYDTEKAEKSRLPDFRNLLYWSPDVNTGRTGTTAISFYTSDQKGKYVGLIQGIDSDGNAGSQYFGFEVK
ncbi:MAG TPA: MG2 domain-containing protein [Mucilaginibacter sp.]